jgi:Glucokinase
VLVALAPALRAASTQRVARAHMQTRRGSRGTVRLRRGTHNPACMCALARRCCPVHERVCCHSHHVCARAAEVTTCACAQKPADITARGMAGQDMICSEAIDVFLDIVGAEAGAMALRSLASGGVYIAGGIPPRLIDRVTNGGLLSSYLNTQSRFSKVTERFPLYVLKKEAGLAGVFNFAMALAKRTTSASSSSSSSLPSTSASL